MSPNNRKRSRTNNQSSNNSFATLASHSSEEEVVNKPTPTQDQPPTHDERIAQFSNHVVHIRNFLSAPDLSEILNGPKTIDVLTCLYNIGLSLETAAQTCPELNDYQCFNKLPSLRKLLEPAMVNHSISTEPPPAPPTHNSVASMTDTTPPPSAQPLNPSSSPKPGPRPPRPPCPKKAQPLTPQPRSHQVRSNVRLVACIAGRADAVTSETPRWKA
ncbi:hypothetical protein FRC11_014648, partial [Ceratobasidium sp. 423]